MRPIKAERPAPAVAGREPLTISALGGSRELTDSEHRLLAQYHVAEQQHADNMILARWIIELRRRLGQALADFERDFSVKHEQELAAECERLRLALLLAKQVREGKQ